MCFFFFTMGWFLGVQLRLLIQKQENVVFSMILDSNWKRRKKIRFQAAECSRPSGFFGGGKNLNFVGGVKFSLVFEKKKNNIHNVQNLCQYHNELEIRYFFLRILSHLKSLWFNENTVHQISATAFISTLKGWEGDLV